MKIYAYVRVSTQNQTVESQKYEIVNYCKNQCIKVDFWITECVSGTVPVDERRLGRKIKKMQKGDMLICTEISRLGRSMLMIMGILNECVQRGIRIRTIKDHFDLSDSINSKIIAFAFALASEIERNLISQRTKEALAAKKSEGVRLGRPPGPSTKYLMYLKKEEEIKCRLINGESLSSVAKGMSIHRNTLIRYMKGRVTFCKK